MKLISYLIIASLFCTTNIFGESKGKINGDFYTAPGNVFTMKIPTIFERIGKTTGSETFPHGEGPQTTLNFCGEEGGLFMV